MAKLMIISCLFAPARRIGAVRWTKIAKHLTGEGHEIHVFASAEQNPTDTLLERDLSHVGEVIRIAHWSENDNAEKKTPSVPEAAGIPAAKPAPVDTGLKNKAKKAILGSRVFKLYAETMRHRKRLKAARSFAENAESYIMANGGIEDYDAVIVTFGPLGGIYLARRLKARCPKVPLIVDFRDPIDDITLPKRQRRSMRRIQDSICETADRIVIVSEGYKNLICDGRWEEKTVVIPNGFDAEDGKGFETSGDDRLTFCCVGNLYLGRRDTAPLFRAIKALADEKRIDLDRVALHYYGTSGHILREQARAAGMESVVVEHGNVDRAAVVAAQRASDVLLLLTWNTESSVGVIPGKLYEYMLAGRPILALTAGELSGGEADGIIDRLRLGFTWEQAQPRDEELKEWIAAQYERHEKGLPLLFEPDTDGVAQYEYANIARKVDELITEAAAEKA